MTTCSVPQRVTVGFVIVALVLTTADTHASEACGLVVARHIAAGSPGAVAKLFVAVGSDSQRALVDLVKAVGEISSLREATAPRFKDFARMSVLSHGLAANYASVVQRVDATSSTLGPIQIEVAIAPGSVCLLLAVHVDAARR